MSEIQDWLRKAENAKADYRWLVLTFFAMWWLASSPVRAEEDRTYGRTALITIAPTSDFLPTFAVLDDEELECSSAEAFTIIQSYAAAMSGIVSTRKIMTAKRTRLEARRDCRTTDRGQIVRVLMIYNLLTQANRWITARSRGFGWKVELSTMSRLAL